MEDVNFPANPGKIDRRDFFCRLKRISVGAALATTSAHPVFGVLVSGETGKFPSNTHGQLLIPGVWWRKLSKTRHGELAYWDTARFRTFKVNWVSVSYRPLDDRNNYLGTSWVIPPPLMKQVMKRARAGLKEAHRDGIQVIGTTDSIQFNPQVMRLAGINPDQLHGRTLTGEKIPFDAYQKGNHLSCLMNPYWQEIEEEIGRAHARAGFDGLFLDLFPYIIKEGILCGCEHCRNGWATYSEKVFGERKDFPKGALHLKNIIDRVFLSWRIEALHLFMEKIQQAGRKQNPLFKVILNCNADNPCMSYLLLQGMLQPTSELGQISAGDESSIYLYRMIDSISRDSLFSQFNGPTQYLPEYKYKTALAEAFAGGGALMLAVKNEAMDGINRDFTTFLVENRNAFSGSVSDAETAILFSWRDHTFLQSEPMIRTDRMLWRRNSARRAAALLASNGIPFDYLCIENGLKAADLLPYKVLVAPELKLLDDGHAALIRDFIRKGGKLLCLGPFGTFKTDGLNYIENKADYLSRWTHENAKESYREFIFESGKIVTIAHYLKGENEMELKPTFEFDKGMAFLELDAQLKVRNNGNGHIASVIRKNGKSRFIHLIRYGCSGKSGDMSVTGMFKISPTDRITRVEAISPYTSKSKEFMKWNVAAGKGQFTTDVEIYTLVRLEFQ